MSIRRGLGAGRGSGYRNIVGKDPYVHSASARGMKQPQIKNIPPVMMKPTLRKSYTQTLSRIAREVGLSPKQSLQFFNEMKNYPHDPFDRTLTVYLRDRARAIKSAMILGDLNWNNLSVEQQDEVTDKYFKERDVYPYEDDGKLTLQMKKILQNEGYSFEKVVGGLGDNRPDSDFDPKELKKGIKVEMEHTTDPKVAKEIARDHLTEFAGKGKKGYYDNLAKMEKKLKKQPNVLIMKDKRYGSFEVFDLQNTDKYLGNFDSLAELKSAMKKRGWVSQ